MVDTAAGVNCVFAAVCRRAKSAALNALNPALATAAAHGASKRKSSTVMAYPVAAAQPPAAAKRVVPVASPLLVVGEATGVTAVDVVVTAVVMG